MTTKLIKVSYTRRSNNPSEFVGTLTTAQFNGTHLASKLMNHSVGDEITLVDEFDVAVIHTFARPDRYGFPTALTTDTLPRYYKAPTCGNRKTGRAARPTSVNIKDIR